MHINLETLLLAKNGKLRQPFTQAHNIGLKLVKHGLMNLNSLDSKGPPQSPDLSPSKMDNPRLARCT